MRLRFEERGATAVEYGLIAGLIALGILGSLVTTRSSLNANFNSISSRVGASGQATQFSNYPKTKTFYTFESQSLSKSTYAGPSSGQTEYLYQTPSGAIMDYISGTASARDRMSLYDPAINNGQNAYYYPAFNGQPEQIIESYVVNNINYITTTTFASDGAGEAVQKQYQMSDHSQIGGAGFDMAVQRADYAYILNEYPLARQLSGY